MLPSDDETLEPDPLLKTFLRRIARITWRTRLTLAFVVLIFSSATATIAIGNAVLGSQILSLAKSKADSDLMIAWQVWQNELDFMSTMIESVAVGPHPDIQAADETVLRLSPGREQFDILSVTQSDDAGNMDLNGLGPDWDIIRDAARQRRAIASPLLLPIADVMQVAPSVALADRMRQFGVDGKVLAIACAAPVYDRRRNLIGVAFAASIVNGRSTPVERMIRAMRPSDDAPDSVGVAATVFQGDRRITTANVHNGNSAAEDYQIPILSAADEKVTRKVVGEGGRYIGVAEVAKVQYYTAYRPIRDANERIIGMLGIGTTVGEYRAAQEKTIALFSSLIGAGMLFGIIMSYLFAAWLGRPLADLAEGMSRVAAGDLDHKVRLHSSDELGRLSKAFNRMIQAVKERDQMLREATEHRLSEVEKQISIGRLAAGVAHEINNPLTSILSLSSLMLRHAKEGAPEREDLEIIVAETTRCREIVAGLLDFARERPTAKKVIDLNQVVRDTLGLIRNYGAMNMVTVEPRYFPGHLFVHADARQLQQVFTNVVLNAAEAIRDRRVVEPDAPARIEISVDDDSSGAFAEVVVKDTGTGIPEHDLKKIFEPFYTTKGKSKGTGLGLSVSLGIIKKHNGMIQVQSAVGQGTTLTVTLPLMAIESQAVSFA